MFPQRLGFHVVFGISLIAALSLCNEVEREDFDVAMYSCCKTGENLNSCSNDGINGSFHHPPFGLCRTVMQMCCLMNTRKTKCERDFVSNYDKFCGNFRNPVSTDETCCKACQAGHEFSLESDFCEHFPKIANDSLRTLIVKCCDSKNKFSRSTKPERLVLNYRPGVRCLGGFYFNASINKCTDINECEIENNGCAENQKCENRIGSYACIPARICKTGYNFDVVNLACKKEVKNDNPGYFDSRKILIPDSDFGASSNTTFFTIRYQKCPKGFIYHQIKKKCVDVDECKSQKKVCEYFCHNTQGSFRCSCPRGYRVDSKNRTACVDINECLQRKEPCSHNCRNVKGSFRCGCPKGFKLGANKSSCEDINECIEKQATCGKQVCNNLIGDYACYDQECPMGYSVVRKRTRNDYTKCERKTCGKFNPACKSQPRFLTTKNVTLLLGTKDANRSLPLHNINISKYKSPVSFELNAKVLTSVKELGILGASIDNFEIRTFPTRAILLLKNFIGSQSICVTVNVRNTKLNRDIEVFTINLTVQKRDWK